MVRGTGSWDEPPVHERPRDAETCHQCDGEGLTCRTCGDKSYLDCTCEQHESNPQPCPRCQGEGWVA